jgi:CheY-like chemotaxis protein
MTGILEQPLKKAFSIDEIATTLIVDDDEHDRSMLADIVTSFKPAMAPRQFGNGLELMQYLSYLSEDYFPKLIFLDLRMPIWDGIRTLKALESEPKYAQIKVYIVSQSDTPHEVALCIRSGAKDFIVKPTTESQAVPFTERIRAIVEQTTNVMA